MKLDINVFDVGKADAILVRLTKGNLKLLLLVDGAYSKDIDHVIDIIKQEVSDSNCLFYILCTHIDSDHINGLIKIIEQLKDRVKGLFIHPQFKTKTSRNRVLRQILPGHGQKALGSIPEQDKVLEISKKLKLNIIHPYSGDRIDSKFPELKIIAPSKLFFRKHYSKISAKRKRILNVNFNPDCFIQQIDEHKRNLSSENLVSYILQLKIDKDKYLFCGDAGISSFKVIKGYKALLSNIYWLKVPHHGSINNLDRELMDIMCPKIAVISGPLKGAEHINNYLNKIKNTNVFVTGEIGDYHFTKDYV